MYRKHIEDSNKIAKSCKENLRYWIINHIIRMFFFPSETGEPIYFQLLNKQFYIIISALKSFMIYGMTVLQKVTF